MESLLVHENCKEQKNVGRIMEWFTTTELDFLFSLVEAFDLFIAVGMWSI